IAAQGCDGRAGDGRDPREGRRAQGVKRPMWTRKAARAFAISAVAAAIGLAAGSGTLVALAGLLLLAPLVALLLDRRPVLAIQRGALRERYQEDEETDVVLTVANQGRSTVFLEVADEVPALFRVKTG